MMNNKTKWFVSAALAFAFGMLCAATSPSFSAQAQNNPFGRPAPRCTLGTASGVYGYHMEGQLIGVGPFLLNGLFTHRAEGTMDAEVQLVVGPQSFPAPGTGGTWTIKDDCTGSGKFTVAALNLEVTYNFIATDGGDQIELLNTNPGVVLHGVGRRIAKPGKAPSCNNGTVLGTYGYRLSGSLPNLPFGAAAGTITNTIGNQFNGLDSGSDTLSLMGQYVSRVNQGTHTVSSNCRGAGTYTDSLGATINYVFTVVDGGDTLYLMSIDPGAAISGVARRLR